MENLLDLVENPNLQVIDEAKLNFFCNHFSIHEAIYKSLSVEEKSVLLKRYYVELDSKFYGDKKRQVTFLVCCLKMSISGLFWS